jgi:hypothetical protein
VRAVLRYYNGTVLEEEYEKLMMVRYLFMAGRWDSYIMQEKYQMTI